MHQVPLSLREANAFVQAHHRHSIPATGCKFAFGLEEGGKLIGAAICGRPVARLLNDAKTLEILRVCTDGTKNANSFLFDKCRKIAVLMGYKRVITYTLEEESGASLKALGAIATKGSAPHGWNSPNRPRQDQPVYHLRKLRWDLPLLPWGQKSADCKVLPSEDCREGAARSSSNAEAIRLSG